MFGAYTISFFGIKQTKRILYPILLMLTTVPFWAYISPELQRPTAYIANQLLQVTGYTSINEGVFIKIPEGLFEVSETCSGVRYQAAAITLALLYVYIYRIRLALSFLIIIVASALAFLSNTIRIYIVILFGHYSNMTHSLLNDHIWLGWVIFSIMILIYIISLSYLINTNLSESNEVGINQYNQKLNKEKSGSIHIAVLIMLVACIGPISQIIIESTKSQIISKPQSIELRLNNYLKTNPNESWKPKWRTPDIEVREAFFSDKGQLDLYVSIYLTQDDGKEVINNLNITYDKKRWKNTGKETVTIEGTEFQKSFLVNRSGSKRVIWKTYIIGEFTTTSEIMAKIYGAVSIFKGRQDAAVVLISLTEEDAQNIGKMKIAKIINKLLYDVTQYLDGIIKE
jgi:EpsI family protein